MQEFVVYEEGEKHINSIKMTPWPFFPYSTNDGGSLSNHKSPNI